MSDPISPILLGRVLERILDDRAERKQLLDEIVPGAPRQLRRAVEQWLEIGPTRLALASNDQTLQNAAAQSLRDAFADHAVDAPPDAMPIVHAAREALLNRQPARQSMLQAEGSIVEQVRRATEDSAERVIEAVRGPGHELAGPLIPSVRESLEELRQDDPETAVWLAGWLTQRPTPEGLRSLLAPDSRIAGADRLAWEAAARYASVNGDVRLSAEFWGKAVAASPRPGRAMANQAFATMPFDRAAARELAEVAAAQADAHLLATAVMLVLDKRFDELIALREQNDFATWEDRIVGGLIVEALVRAERYDDAVRLAEQVAAADEAADARRQLAGVLFVRVLHGASEHHSAELNRARQLALAAREQYHTWGVPSPQATQLAMQISMQLAELRDIVALAESCREEGWAAELDDPVSAGLIAMASAVEGAEATTVDGLSQVMHRYLAAIGPYLLSDELPVADSGYAEALLSALELATTDEDVARILRALARVDAAPLDRVDDLAKRQPRAADFIRATALQARGSVDQAAALIRPHASESPEGAWALAHLLEEAGEVDQLAEIAADSWPRFHDVGLLTFSLQTGTRSEELGDSAAGRLRDTAVQALADDGLSDTQRRRLLRQLAALDARAGRWTATAEWCSQLRAADPDAEDVPWMLARAQVNAGRADRAWQALQDADGLVRPTSSDAARLAAGLALTYGQGPRHVHALLEYRQFVEDVEAHGVLIMAALQLALQSGDADANERAHAELGAFLDEHPDNGVIQRVSVDELIGMGGLDQLAPPIPAAVGQIQEGVTAGRAPFATLAMLTTTPYASLLARNRDGVLHAASNAVAHRSRERTAAGAALGSTVLIDETALYVLAALEVELSSSQLPDRLLAAFHRVELTAEAALDVANGAGALGLATDSVVVPPVEGTDGLHQLVDTPPEVIERRQHVIRAMLHRAERLPRNLDEAPRILRHDEVDRPNWDAALAAVDVAIAGGTPVWADDHVLRRWMRVHGVQTFGTRSLIDVLERQGLISDGDSAALRAALRAARVADLPAPVGELLVEARQSAFAGGAPLVPLVQPGWWASLHNMLHGVDELFAAIGTEAPEQMPIWFHAAAVGTWRHTLADAIPARICFHLLWVCPTVRPHATAMLAMLDDALGLVGRPPATPEQLSAALLHVCGDDADEELLSVLLPEVDDQRVAAAAEILAGRRADS